MITPSFSPTATERVLPKLALDFTTASLDSRITFTRTTDATHPATYVASTGYITAATNNQPRFDYDPVALTCKGLLIEESRANLFTNSNNFSGTGWNASNVIINGTQVTSPDGTANATPLIENNSAGQHNVNQVCTTTGQKTFTVYAKIASGTRYLRILDYNATNGVQGESYFNLNAGTVISGPGLIQNAGNGFYRCSITTTTTVSSTYYISLATAVNTYNYTGDGTSGIYIWGAQLEAGAFPTSYIPTTSAALTRNADVATMTGTNFSSWYNAAQGTFEAEYTIPYALGTGGTPRILSINGAGGSTVDEIALYLIQASGKAASANTWAAGVNPGRLDSGQSFVAGTKYKGVLAYSSNRQLTTNATAPTVSVTVYTIPTVTSMNIGSNSVTANGTNGWISKVWYYKQSLTTAEVQAFSK